MVPLQEDGFIYSYGMVRFTCISISILVGRRVCITSLVGRSVCIVHTLLPTRLLILMRVKRTIP